MMASQPVLHSELRHERSSYATRELWGSFGLQAARNALSDDTRFVWSMPTDLMSVIERTGEILLPGRVSTVETDCGDVGVVCQRAPAQTANVGWSATLDKIIVELGRLGDGWDGEGSHAPTAKLLRDVEQALSVLPTRTREPEVEVDSSDGSAAFRWWSDGDGRSLTMSFTGSGRVYLIEVGPNGPEAPAVTCDIIDETRIVDAIEAFQAEQQLLAIA